METTVMDARVKGLEKARALRMAGAGKKRAFQPRFTPLKAIREKCLDCAQSKREVALCNIVDCSLWEYRFGTRPTQEMVEAAQGIPVCGRDKSLYNGDSVNHRENDE